MTGAEGRAAQLKAQASALFLQALALSTQIAPRQCDHTSVEFVAGNLVHCSCGQAFKVPCQHLTVERVLPRVWRCVDCREWRGGELREAAE